MQVSASPPSFVHRAPTGAAPASPERSGAGPAPNLLGASNPSRLARFGEVIAAGLHTLASAVRHAFQGIGNLAVIIAAGMGRNDLVAQLAALQIGDADRLV